MKSKARQVGRIEFVKNGNSFLALDLGGLGILFDRTSDVQGFQVYRKDGYGEFSEMVEDESGCGCELPHIEIRRDHFLEIEAVAMGEYIDFGELDRLLKKYLPKIMSCK